MSNTISISDNVRVVLENMNFAMDVHVYHSFARQPLFVLIIKFFVRLYEFQWERNNSCRYLDDILKV